MTNYSKYHAFRKWNWRVFSYGWISDGICSMDKPCVIREIIERKGYTYVASSSGYGDCAIAKGKHKILKPLHLFTVKYFSLNLGSKIYSFFYNRC